MPLLPAAIGIVFNTDRTEVLFIKRRDVPVWVLPGGGIEENESPQEALIREVQEETGYLVTIERKSAEYFPINRLSAFTTVFICQIAKGSMSLSAETAEIAFYPISQLPSSIFPPHARWLHEALSSSALIRRPLSEISYLSLSKYFIRHPYLVLRYAWTRFFKK